MHSRRQFKFDLYHVLYTTSAQLRCSERNAGACERALLGLPLENGRAEVGRDIQGGRPGLRVQVRSPGQDQGCSSQVPTWNSQAQGEGSLVRGEILVAGVLVLFNIIGAALVRSALVPSLRSLSEDSTTGYVQSGGTWLTSIGYICKYLKFPFAALLGHGRICLKCRRLSGRRLSVILCGLENTRLSPYGRCGGQSSVP